MTPRGTIAIMNKPQPPAPVNLIVGEDEFLAERRRKAIAQQARQASGDPNLPVEMHKASEISEPELLELLSPSLFAEDRIIYISEIEDKGKDVVELVEGAIRQPAPGIVLIVWHKGKGRNKKLVQAWPKLGAVVHEAAPLKGRAILSFIDNEFRGHGVRVSSDVTNALHDAVGSDLRELASAVSQLVADTDGNVTADTVHTYYVGRAEVSGFDVADLAVTGYVTNAVAMARRAMQVGAKPIALATALGMGVTGIAKVSGAGRIDARRDASAFGMSPWQLEKTVRNARNWTPAAIAEAVQIVADLDGATKGSALDEEYAVEEAVRAIAELAARGNAGRRR